MQASVGVNEYLVKAKVGEGGGRTRDGAEPSRINPGFVYMYVCVYIHIHNLIRGVCVPETGRSRLG